MPSILVQMIDFINGLPYNIVGRNEDDFGH